MDEDDFFVNLNRCWALSGFHIEFHFNVLVYEYVSLNQKDVFQFSVRLNGDSVAIWNAKVRISLLCNFWATFSREIAPILTNFFPSLRLPL